MEYVLDTLEMKRCDETAINEYGIESLILMERAALETAKIIVEHYGKDIYVGVVAGRGNNGGDGVAIARILNESGIRVEINILDEPEKCSAETKRQLEIAQKIGIDIHYGIEHTLYDVIVDAIFGIGLKRNIEGKYRKAVECINLSKARKVAVDIPSGVNTDDGSIMGCAVKADITVTYAYRKIGHMLYPGASCSGKVYCVPIGIPKQIIESKKRGVVTFTSKEDLRLPKRKSSGNKGSFGKVLIIAGSKNMGGACQLSALAAFRIGSGMVKVFTASENRESLLRKVPEAIINTYIDDENGTLLELEEKELMDGLKWANVIALGPGISMSDKAKRILQLVMEYNTKPLVLDADALNIISQDENMLSKFKYGNRDKDYDVVMTPHIGEFARLMHYPIAEIKKDLLGCCKLFTKKYDISLVCKDARTIISKKGKFTYINASGNDGMATAGSGDVLTGIIAGLMAQRQSGFEAAVMGAYAHGLAGNDARNNSSSYYIMAQDIIKSLKNL